MDRSLCNLNTPPQRYFHALTCQKLFHLSSTRSSILGEGLHRGSSPNFSKVFTADLFRRAASMLFIAIFASILDVLDVHDASRRARDLPECSRRRAPSVRPQLSCCRAAEQPRARPSHLQGFQASSGTPAGCPRQSLAQPCTSVSMHPVTDCSSILASCCCVRCSLHDSCAPLPSIFPSPLPDLTELLVWRAPSGEQCRPRSSPTESHEHHL